MFRNADYIAHRREKDGEIQSLVDLVSNWRRRVEHVGAKKAIDQEGPLIV